MNQMKIQCVLYIVSLGLITKSLVKSLPVQNSASLISISLSDLNSHISEVPVQDVKTVRERSASQYNSIHRNVLETNQSGISATEVTFVKKHKYKKTLNLLIPGQIVRNYNVQITIDGALFLGKVMLEVRSESRDDPLKLYTDGLDINSVILGRANDMNAIRVEYQINDEGTLEIDTSQRPSNLYLVIIEYTGLIRNDGTGVFMGHFNNQMYLGMNLYPTHAKRVFPCIDALTEIVPVTFTFHRVDFPKIVSNSMFAANSVTEFRTLPLALHLWAMVAHNFASYPSSTSENVILHGRALQNQHVRALEAIRFIFDHLNDWTNKKYSEIIANQNGFLNVFALPDTSVAWHGLSTVGIWEPFLYMESTHSVAHRYKAFVKIGEALAGQWFGFVIYPQNWRHQWIITGLQLYSAYDILRQFQSDPYDMDNTLLDMNILFVTDVIQESLIRDGFAVPSPLLLEDDISSESQIRSHLNGILKYKAPAFLWMMKHILGETDYIHLAAQSLLSHWSLEPVTTMDLIDMIYSAYDVEPVKLIPDIESFMLQWIKFTGFPIVTVQLTSLNEIYVNRDHYPPNQLINYTEYQILLTYTTSTEMNFDNIYSTEMLQHNMLIPTTLPEEEGNEFILFNIQGQGYYRVNYDEILWERIISCLQEPSCREQIHPLNRATLLDDSLNLARAGKLSYDIAFQVVLAMEHETEYAPWKAYVRNMDFIRKRLMAFLAENDLNIYLRLIRKVINRFENEVDFYPDPSEPAMVSLTRGIVMDHACRAGLPNCVAAAIDLFYNPDSNEPVVNPNIPKDIRPAVYCTVVREGDAEVISALHQRLTVEPSHYERIVILESLGCSKNSAFIQSLLAETVAETSPYGVEERSQILAAILKSSYENARIANVFMNQNIRQIRNTYGGSEKLEELIWVLAENCANDVLTENFNSWVFNSLTLEDSTEQARRAVGMTNQNLIWDKVSLEDVYEWIDRNDASTLALSAMFLLGALSVSFKL